MAISSGANVIVEEPKKPPAATDIAKEEEPSRWKQCVFETSGIVLGLVRMVICLPVLGLFMAHAHSPPVSSNANATHIADNDGIKIVSQIWGYT